MAASLLLRASLPNILQHRWVYDGTGSADGLRTQTELIADCARNAPQSELKALLEGAVTDDAWRNLALVAVAGRNVLGGRRSAPLAVSFETFAEGRGIVVKGIPSIAGMADVEIRLR